MYGKIVCPECGEIMEVKKNGVVVRMRNYLGYFRADLYECPICGKQVLTNFGSEFFDYDGYIDFDFKGDDDFELDLGY